LVISFGLVLILARFLPKTTIFHRLVSETASGVHSGVALATEQTSQLGKFGVAIVPLCPGGKARFDEQLLDVITRGEMVEKGRPVRIIGHTGSNAVVEETTN
jgi:membrane-bound serine protease (ClpP class)